MATPIPTMTDKSPGALRTPCWQLLQSQNLLWAWGWSHSFMAGFLLLLFCVLPVECAVQHCMYPFPTFACGVCISYWILFTTMFHCIYLFRALPFHGLCGSSWWLATSMHTFPCAQACCSFWELHVNPLMLLRRHSACHIVQRGLSACNVHASTTKSTSLNI